MSKRILVVAAHPDDEILGIGGTVINHAVKGDETYCLILAEGVKSRESGTDEEVKELRQQGLMAGKILGYKDIFFAGLPDNSLDTISLLSVAKEVERCLEKIKPDILYTHFENDLNIDHRIAFRAVTTASRPCNNNCPKEIYTFETLSSTEWQGKNGQKFAPNCYINIENTIDKKIEAMKKYKNEMRKYPHSRSAEGIKILAQYRGLECGLKFAEALQLVRRIV
ncbi:PIG-L family deacetylase [Candidatus Peregrinibacteria bacterium]|nr:PIG-L family deacetylase [Candidatus Peregrinibacteria bacterium]